MEWVDYGEAIADKSEGRCDDGPVGVMPMGEVVEGQDRKRRLSPRRLDGVVLVLWYKVVTLGTLNPRSRDPPTSANPNPPNPPIAPHALSTPHTPPGHAIKKKHVTLSPADASLSPIPNLQNLPRTGNALENPNRDPNFISPDLVNGPSNFEDKVECPTDGNVRGEPNVPDKAH
ncbi:hypothetical protein ACSQ67_020997 [Phaseolus vulgaris]